MRGQKDDGEVVPNWRTNDQIMPRFGRNFIINDKGIFQVGPNTKSSLED